MPLPCLPLIHLLRRGPGVLPLLAALLWLCMAAPLRAAPLVLHDAAGALDAWPAIRVLKDPAGAWSAADALSRLDSFGPPAGPHANLGPQRGAVWLYLPLQVPAGLERDWILDIDYPSLQRIDIVQLRAGRLLPPATLGTAVLRRHWPLPSRAPAVPLAIEPGQREHAVLMRIESSGGMVVPVRLARAGAYKLAEERTQAFQGLIAGLVMFLLLYSLIQWFVWRDLMYLDYALMNVGVILLSQVQFGLAAQHLWPGSAWLTHYAAPAAVLLGSVGTYRFVARWLAGMGAHHRVVAGLHAGAVLIGAVLAGLAAGWISYRVAVVLSSLVAPLPMLVALPTVFGQARAGSRQARTMLLGWICFAAGATAMAMLVHGLLPASTWTQHAFQVCSLAEMTLFMAVLGLRVDDMRRAAEAAQRENAALQALAHTDPLTGLLNRRGLQLALDQALLRATPEHLMGVYLIDLDGFKPINDHLGHDAGDTLLVAVGARLRTQVRAGDAVARLGGDEFVVVVQALPGEEEAERLGRKLLEAFDAPFYNRGQACRVGLTIGYALAPMDGVDADHLLKRADAAMYAGKQAGRCCVRRGAAAPSDGRMVSDELGSAPAFRATN
jgi:diguanylate cyclase (GGDEF)-like protein